MTTAIQNPVPAGARLLIAKGTPVSSMHPGWGPDERRPVGRTHTVTISSVLAGWVELNGGHRDWRPRIVLPVIRWAGAGSYWMDTQVTPELLAVNGLAPLTLPDLDPNDVRLLDAALSFDRTSTNQW